MNTINFTATINPTIDIARLDLICASIKANVQAFADFESDAFFMGDTLPVRPVFLSSWERKLFQLEELCASIVSADLEIEYLENTL